MTEVTGVQQAYCTHCLTQDAAFGSGYTVRAGSLPRDALQQCYGDFIEVWCIPAQVRTPQDTRERSLRRRRPTACPSGWPIFPTVVATVLMHACYRQRHGETSVVVRPSCIYFFPGPAATPVGRHGKPASVGRAGWVLEDSPHLPRFPDRLAVLGSIHELLGSQRRPWMSGCWRVL